MPKYAPWLLWLVLGTLLFFRLDHWPLWGDEHEDVNYLHAIEEHGVPDMTGSPFEGGYRLNDQGWLVYQPWAYLYTSLWSYRLSGNQDYRHPTPMRLPGMLAAWLALGLTAWLTVLKGWSPFLALVMLGLNPFFFWAARSSRYYGWVLLWTALLLWLWHVLRKHFLWRQGLCALVSGLCFHFMTMHGAILWAMTCLLWWGEGRPGGWRALALTGLVFAALVLPWLAWVGLPSTGLALGWGNVSEDFSKGLVVWGAGFFPLVLLGLSCFRQGVYLKISLLLSLLCGLGVCLSTVVTPTPRYFLPLLIPVTLWLVGALHALAQRHGQKAGVVLCLVLISSNLLYLFPWALIKAHPRFDGDPAAERFAAHVLSLRSLVWESTQWLWDPPEHPSQSLSAAMTSLGGFKKGERVVHHCQHHHPLDHGHYIAKSLFLQTGHPLEELGLDTFVDDVNEADWIVDCQEVVPPQERPGWVKQFCPIAFSFWLDGPNPWNRRYRPEEGKVCLWKKSPP